ncbi:MAG TPA: TetR/AcrR family transcriptional regulator [Nocardioidaceae bacterium]|nr:TetR/AcrR family transcriptional regulator [Nocardioidaceae bacterium]
MTAHHQTSDQDAPAQHPPKRGRGRPRDPKADTRIRAAAAQLMVERGFDRMTVDDVAERAGVGKATVYRRWPSKSDLAVAAISEVLTTEFPESDTGSIVTDLRASLVNVLTFANSAGGVAFLKMCIAESIRDPRIAALYRESSDRREVQSKETFERAIARGEVRADARLDYALNWIGGILASRIISDRPLPGIDEVDDMLAFILRGVLADPSRHR